MKIAIIGSIYSLLMNELIELLYHENNEVHILDLLHGEYYIYDESYPETINIKRKNLKRNSRKMIRIYHFIKNYLIFRKKLHDHFFDVCNIHGIHSYYFPLAQMMKRHCRLFICSVYGSEFNKASQIQRRGIAILFRYADKITFTNESTEEKVNTYYKDIFKSKTTICRFGLNHLKRIESLKSNQSKHSIRKQLQLPLDKRIITCGYGRSKNHQHELIIQSILNCIPSVQNKLFLLFPMTYGSDIEQIEKVNTLLTATTIPYRIHSDFLPTDEACLYVIASDIMINIPMDDQFNGAMQEMLFAGNIVINGGWLPYEILDHHQVDVFKVNDSKELTRVIERVIKEEPSINITRNREVINKLSDWDSTIANWLSIYHSNPIT